MAQNLEEPTEEQNSENPIEEENSENPIEEQNSENPIEPQPLPGTSRQDDQPRPGTSTQADESPGSSNIEIAPIDIDSGPEVQKPEEKPRRKFIRSSYKLILPLSYFLGSGALVTLLLYTKFIAPTFPTIIALFLAMMLVTWRAFPGLQEWYDKRYYPIRDAIHATCMKGCCRRQSSVDEAIEGSESERAPLGGTGGIEIEPYLVQQTSDGPSTSDLQSSSDVPLVSTPEEQTVPQIVNPVSCTAEVHIADRPIILEA